MKRPVLATLLFAATIFSVNLASVITPRVHADTVTETTDVTAITAGCFDAASTTAYWQISNPNTTTTTVAWTAADSVTTGSYDAPAGTSQLTTPYNAADPTESFVFSQDDADDSTLQVAQTACATPAAEEPEACVDGSNRANLDFSSSKLGVVDVYTATGAPLCDDVTVYLTSYTLPADYDKSGIFDDSAIPQKLYGSDSVVLHKGTNGGATLTAAVPDVCTDYQLDLYYAPEITVVTGAGHGNQLIYGNIVMSDPDDPACSTGAPGMGGGPTTPVDTTPVGGQGSVAATPVQATTVAATTLTDTGTQTWAISLIAAVLLAGGIATRFTRPSRVQS